MMDIATAKVVGTPTQSAWTQVQTSFSSDEIDRKCLVSVLAVNLYKDETKHISRDLLSGFHESCFSGMDLPLKTLKEGAERMAGVVGSASVELVSSAVVGKYIYFSAFGQGCVFLWRDGKLVNILRGERASPLVCSGVWAPRDVFVLGTADFFKKIGVERLGRMLEEGLPIQELADKMATLTFDGPSASLAAAIVKMPDLLQDDLVVTVRELPIKKIRFSPGKVLALLAHKLPEEVAFVPRQSRTPRTAVSVGVILLLVLVASLFFGAHQKKQQDFRASYAQELTQAEAAYNDSLAQKDVNPPLARDRFTEAKAQVENLLARGIQDPQLAALKTKIDQGSITILGKVEEQPVLFLDLYLVRSDIKAGALALGGDTLAVLDTGGKRVISVSTGKKEANPVGGSEKLGTPKSLSLYKDINYIFSDQGILQVSSRGSVSVIVKPDSEWGDIVKIGVFGGNIYLLDRKGEIWRYVATDSGFGSKQAWLKNGVTGDFSNSVDMTIDGSVWILSSSGRIDKFTHGAGDSFRVSGMNGAFSNPTALYTDENLDSVFILDKGNKRIVQLSKNGEHQKEYTGSGIEDANDFVVSKKEGKIFLLENTKILELQLR